MDNGSIFAMQMGREPLSGPQSVHDILGSNTSQLAIPGVLFQMCLVAKQLLMVSLPLDRPRPIVTDANVDLCPDLEKLPHVNLSNVIYRLDIAAVVWEALMVAVLVVEAFPDATHSSYSQRTQPQDIGSAHVVDVWGDPSSVVEFEQVVGRLVVSADEDGKVWCGACAGVVLVEVVHCPVLGGHGDGG